MGLAINVNDFISGSDTIPVYFGVDKMTCTITHCKHNCILSGLAVSVNDLTSANTSALCSALDDSVNNVISGSDTISVCFSVDKMTYTREVLMVFGITVIG